MSRRQCGGRKADGAPCLSPPLRQGEFCLWHDPERQQEAQQARRLGGLRRRRETTVASAYHFDGLGSIVDIRRLLEVAAFDTLGLENSIARARTLAYLAQVSARLLEGGEIEERLKALEATLRPPRPLAH